MRLNACHAEPEHRVQLKPSLNQTSLAAQDITVPVETSCPTRQNTLVLQENIMISLTPQKSQIALTVLTGLHVW